MTQYQICSFDVEYTKINSRKNSLVKTEGMGVVGGRGGAAVKGDGADQKKRALTPQPSLSSNCKKTVHQQIILLLQLFVEMFKLLLWVSVLNMVWRKFMKNAHEVNEVFGNQGSLCPRKTS